MKLTYEVNRIISFRMIRIMKLRVKLKIKSKPNLCRSWYCIYCTEKFVHPSVEDWIQYNKCEE